MLVYDVRALLADPRLVIAIDETVDVSSLSSGGQTYRVIQIPQVTCTIVNVDGEVLRAVGDIRFTLEAPCDRCLEPVTVPLEIHFEQRFAQDTAQSEAAKDQEVEPFQGYQLDLREVIQDEIQLGIPMKILCKEDCLGLCPQCGKNRNLGSCSCVLQDEDPRLSGLRALWQERK